MNEKDLFYLIGYLKVSRNRTKTLKALGRNLKMPSEIGRETGLRTSQVSKALGDMKMRDLVVCVNEEARKGRLYKCTALGLEILDYL